VNELSNWKTTGATMKRKMLLVLSVSVLLLSGCAFGQKLENNNEVGVGFMLGEPSGLDAQFFWSKRSALDIGVAWSLQDWLMITGDWQVYNTIADSPPEWKWFYGAGAWIALPKSDQGNFGVRVPIGIKYRIPNSIVDIWGKVAPGIRLIPDTRAEIMGGVGVTFWIK
jgi:hypothetical protein